MAKKTITTCDFCEKDFAAPLPRVTVNGIGLDVCSSCDGMGSTLARAVEVAARIKASEAPVAPAGLDQLRRAMEEFDNLRKIQPSPIGRPYKPWWTL